MKKQIIGLFLFSFLTVQAFSQSTIKLTAETLMNEIRLTPSPLNHAVVSDREVSLMWPMPPENIFFGSDLDGMEEENPLKISADQVNYRIRLSQDSKLKKHVITADCYWGFYNPEKKLRKGDWYWQYGYVKNGETRWSEVLKFTVGDNPNKFNPPFFKDLIKKVPRTHPRILVFENEWNEFLTRNIESNQRAWYLEKTNDLVGTKIGSIVDLIDTTQIAGLENRMQRQALLTRESRRVIDREEANTDALIRSYVVTKDKRYLDTAMQRIKAMISWKQTPYFVGDFNQATLLSLTSMAYDSFFHELSESDKQLLLAEIKENGTKIFNGFVNHLEYNLVDNHNWQMNFRIFTMAAFAVYGDLPEADRWVDYSYNLWVARFPGLNKDGGWHNGDSYFHVNIRTLIEVPFFYSRISGFDFFSDPWYQGSANYVMFQQPPFSKSGGNGSAHLRVVRPSGVRVGYADALARMTGNGYLVSYVNTILEKEPNILKKAFMAKPGDLGWFRMLNTIPLPEPKPLSELPLAYVFPQTGLASLMSNWGDIRKNAMLSFRSSPFGSTSHAIANQNAFNTFYAGEPLFYSSGHHISFTDKHTFYCHRGTKGHNTILVNGMGQKIGTEGYGWIPRSYVGEQISYFVGDASNAYGNITAPIWLIRGRDSHLEFTPENGWDKNHLKTFRRHVVELGSADLVFIYDELEADSTVTWDYLLHTVKNPMQVNEQKQFVHIKAVGKEGMSDAYLFSPDRLKVTTTDKFDVPAINWLRADDNGNFPPYDSHWHFKATAPANKVYRFATVINTHGNKQEVVQPERINDSTISVGDWVITMNLSTEGAARFTVENKKENTQLIYNDSTKIIEGDKTTVLKDEIPELEI